MKGTTYRDRDYAFGQAMLGVRTTIRLTQERLAQQLGVSRKAVGEWERCRVVSVLGLGGIGKSALAARLMHEVAARFQVVIWRSLRDAPPCEALLDECLQVLAPQARRDGSLPLERRLSLLLESLRSTR